MQTLTRSSTPLPGARVPGRPVGRTAGGSDGLVVGALGVLALVAWVSAVLTADVSRMNGLGLISVLGPAYWVAVASIVAALIVELARPQPRPYLLTALVIVTILIIYGSAPAIEPIARNPTSWTHVGFVNYIAQHGGVLTGYDARFSWPGMFALAAVVDTITGQHNPVIFLAWAPVVFELLYLPALRMIARSSGVSARAGWIGTALFYCFNWIDQDYFSPQALNLLFFLVIVACVLAFWRPPPLAVSDAPLGITGRVRASWRKLNGGVGVLGRHRQPVVVLCMFVIMAACVSSHQFTPYALATALISCYLTRRLPGPELPLVLGIMALGWLSFATVNFWQGHLSLLFGGVGSISNSIGANVSNRIQGSLSHRLIVDLRLVLGAFSIAAAGIGALLRKRQSRTLEFLTITPFGLLLLGSYGGEALLRCFLFSLPFSALLIGSLLARPFEVAIGTTRRGAVPAHALARPRISAIGCAAVGALIVGIIAATTLARGGNDAFESFTPTERAAVVYVYAHAKPGQSVSSTTPSTEQLPWRDQRVGTLRFEAPTSTSSPASIGSSILHVRPDWVIATNNQQWWGELVEGWQTNWQTEVVDHLKRSGYVVARTWIDAVVLKRESHHAAPKRPS